MPVYASTGHSRAPAYSAGAGHSLVSVVSVELADTCHPQVLLYPAGAGDSTVLMYSNRPTWRCQLTMVLAPGVARRIEKPTDGKVLVRTWKNLKT